ncbi:MAG: radical SAM family heme chaperone HemW [Firmicutes bacterium]|nr:radical SAM family heme chaperone HemW [Alicyclobacillaceae bacterium]MCL6496948.1 radical SAM family heme chaperone HemW [Bacillota bacterium]
MEWGLYVHLPFCRRRCSYCDFPIRVGAGSAEMAAYVGAVLREGAQQRERWAIADPPTTVYLGGGTPSLVDPGEVERLLEGLGRIFGGLGREVTLEANPETVDGNRPARWRQAGINRLSIGVQSLDDRLLAAMRRPHRAAEARAAVAAAKAAGFENLNCDLIYGWPGQSLGTWAATLAEVIRWRPAHISCYQLQVEPHTPLAHSQLPGPGDEAEEALRAAMGDLAEQWLEAAGYRRYELSNFARPGFACAHNQGYWRLRPYLGLGVGAHSFWAGRRWWNLASVRRYVAALEAGAGVEAGGEALDPVELMRERLWLGLREREGVERTAFFAQFGLDWNQAFGRTVARLQALGLVVDTGDRLCLTRRGREVANVVARALVDAPWEGAEAATAAPVAFP